MGQAEEATADRGRIGGTLDQTIVADGAAEGCPFGGQIRGLLQRPIGLAAC